LDFFTRLENKVGAPGAGLADIAAEVVDLATSAWPEVSHEVAQLDFLVADLTASINDRRKTLMARASS
jgi:hypothetical protein